jgi:hypothetical protein
MMKTQILCALLVQPLLIGLIFPNNPVFGKEACVRAKQGNIICGELVSEDRATLKPKPKKDVMVIEGESGIRFTLHGCSKSSTGVACSIDAYNSTDFDRNLEYQGGSGLFPSTLVDNEGHSYKASGSVIAGRENPKAPDVILPPKAIVKSKVLFQPDGPLSNNIRILRLMYVSDSKRQARNATFRDFYIK